MTARVRWCAFVCVCVCVCANNDTQVYLVKVGAEVLEVLLPCHHELRLLVFPSLLAVDELHTVITHERMSKKSAAAA
jgi:hypothetical protein